MPSDPSRQRETLDIQQIFSARGWQVVRSLGAAGVFHHTAPPDDPAHRIWIHRVPRPALVLGSTQSAELIDRDRAERDGIEVCRRRSGGGLVFINPETDCWVDVIVPSHSALWSPDVGTAFHWVGNVWAGVLGTPNTVVSEERAGGTTLGRVWCFADLGHGEVSIGDMKVVGLSQRRTRAWARIQCLVAGSWDGRRIRPYVDLESLVQHKPDVFPNAAELDPALVRAGPPHGVSLPSPAELADRFVAASPSVGGIDGRS